MADIQPKNTDTIRVNKIKEKTGGSSITLDNNTLVDTLLEKTVGNGVRLNAILKATTALLPLSANIDIGSTTIAEHIRKVYAQALAASGQSLTVGTLTAHDAIMQANAVTMQTLKGAASSNTPANRLALRYGDMGFTSVGEIEEFTANCTTTSTSPVVAFTYTIPQTNTQVMFEVSVATRDNTAGSGSHIRATCSASRAGAGAVAGSVGTTALNNGTALTTLTLNATGNNIQIRLQNVSGTNTTYSRLFIRAIPVSTST